MFDIQCMSASHVDIKCLYRTSVHVYKWGHRMYMYLCVQHQLCIVDIVWKLQCYRNYTNSYYTGVGAVSWSLKANKASCVEINNYMFISASFCLWVRVISNERHHKLIEIYLSYTNDIHVLVYLNLTIKITMGPTRKLQMQYICRRIF